MIEWKEISIALKMDWLSGLDYDEHEVIFCDKKGSFCGVIQSGHSIKSKPAWVSYHTGGRNPTHFMLLPEPPK